MPKADLVPTFIDGQDRRVADPRPYSRQECREARNRGEGLFRDHGQVFVFFRAIVRPAPENDREGAIPRGKVSANSRTQGLIAPERLHYPVPALGARNRPLYCSDINQVQESASCA